MHDDGLSEAWDIISGLDPGEVCRRAEVSFDYGKNEFSLRLFSRCLLVSLPERKILLPEAVQEPLWEMISGHAAYPVLRYLVSAVEAPLSGKFINPSMLTGGDIYLRGSHRLPLHLIEEKYGKDGQGFLGRGVMLGGEAASMGDVSFVLFPLPRIAVALILWLADDEFPARALMLADSSCDLQLPPDALWATLMMCLQALL